MTTWRKILYVVGWIVTSLVIFGFGFSAYMKLSGHPLVAEDMVGKFGYSKQVIFPIGILEAVCLILYVLPQTAILGAVLLTGYVGGAIATHVRVGDEFMPPAILGVLLWLGIYLRDSRLWALLPLRRRGDKIETAPPSK